MRGDVRDRDFPLKEEFEILYNEGFWWLQGPGGDALVGVLGRLAPLQGTKFSIAAEDNPVKDSNKWMCWRQGRDVLGHPQSHLVGDHVPLCWH